MPFTDPSQTTCLGCVYIFPNDVKFPRRSEITAVGNDLWADWDAVVYRWRTYQMVVVRGAEVSLHAVWQLCDWLAEESSFEKYLFVTNEHFEAQASRFHDMGLNPGRLRQFRSR